MQKRGNRKKWLSSKNMSLLIGVVIIIIMIVLVKNTIIIDAIESKSINVSFFMTDVFHRPEEISEGVYRIAKAKGILGDCNVYSNEADRSALRPPSGITSVGTIECAGGLVFESKDRSVRLDYRFETMLEEVWSQKMNEIYTQLFG